MKNTQINELVNKIKSSVEILPRYDLHTCNYKMEEDEEEYSDEEGDF